MTGGSEYERVSVEDFFFDNVHIIPDRAFSNWAVGHAVPAGQAVLTESDVMLKETELFDFAAR